MSIFDTAKALSLLQTATGWGKIEIEKRGIMSRSRQIDFERIIELPEEIHSLISEPSQDGKYDKGKVTQRHVQRVTESGVDKPTVVSVLKKAAEEGLSSEQTRKVAEAVKQAETPEERQAILDTPMDNPMLDRIVRAKARAEIEHKAVEAERHMGNTHEVKEFLDAMNAFEKAISIIMEAIDYKAISPESVQYTVNRLAKVTESINDLTIKLMEAK